jgi:anti-sigma regulatory factor (Ser/Thr protein kinase)
MPFDEMETQFPAMATASQDARAFLRTALHTWALDGFGDVAELLTSELVSNVVRHVGDTMTLRVSMDGTCLRVAVDDTRADPPVLRHPGPGEFRGRGILFVDTLADRWGAEIRDDGKSVWFELDVGTATREVHGSEGSA